MALCDQLETRLTITKTEIHHLFNAPPRCTGYEYRKGIEMRISRIQIKNFRNFANLDIKLGTHAVIVGENKSAGMMTGASPRTLKTGV